VVATAAVAWTRSVDLRRARAALGRAERARVEMELRQLKHTLSPHFLFNNLNILTAIIDEDPRRAADFSARLGRIYRYLVRHRDDDLVPLTEELAFVRDYASLLEARFGAAWEFAVPPAPAGAADLLVVPTAIQTLIENAVKHNAADRRSRLRIRVELEPEQIVVSNPRRPLAEPVGGAGSGTGLASLVTRYAYLADRPVEVDPGAAEFVVRLPLIRWAR
jgi:two-component system, LytTR family, sensor kinase